MRTIIVRLLDNGVSLSDDILGRAGEKNVVQLSIDFSVLRDVGLSTAMMLYRPRSGPVLPGEAMALPSSGSLNVTVPEWAMSVEGTTQVQLQLTGDNAEARSYVWDMRVMHSLVNRGETPKPVKDWLDEVKEVVEDVKEWPEIKAAAEEATQRANEAADEAIADTATGLTQIQQASVAAQEDVAAQGELVKADLPADYTALSATVDKIEDDYAPAIVESAEGEVVVVEDSADRALKGLRVFGRSEQATTTGKNLLENTAQSKTESGITHTVNDDGSITVNGTASDSTYLIVNAGFELAAGTPYVASGCPSGGSWSTYYLRMESSDGDTWADAGSGLSVQFDAATTVIIKVYIVKGTTVSNLTFYPMIRLATITDATYEPYTGGAPSPSPDYPQLLNSVGDDGAVEVTAAGKNLFNSAWVQGVINPSDGEQASDSSTVCTADYIAVTPGEVYTMKRTVATLYMNTRAYDVNKNFVGVGSAGVIFVRGDGGSDSNLMSANCYWVTFRVVDGVHYLKFNDKSNDLSTQYMMVLGEEVPTAYEPYKPATPVTLSTPNGLPGIPVGSGGNYTDGDGQQWICDEVDLERGVYVQRVQKMQLTSTMGTGWYAAMNGKRIYTEIKTLQKEIGSPILCTHAVKGEWASDATGTVCLGNANAAAVGFSTADFATADAVKAFLDANDVFIVAPLSTPIETPLTASELAAYKAMLSRKPTTTVYNDAGAHMAVDYVADTKTWINNKIAALSAAIVNNA